jgi:hypothetical protein
MAFSKRTERQGTIRKRSVFGTEIEDTPVRDFNANIGDGLRAVVCFFLDRDGSPLLIGNWSFKLDVRRRDLDEPAIVSCTPENGRLIVDESEGSVSINLSGEDIRNITDTGGKYDLRVVIPDRPNPIYPVRGVINVQRRITRE